MSHDLHRPVWNTRLGNLTAKNLLAMLIEEVNDDGFGFPGLEQIVRKTEISRITVLRMLRVFDAMGLSRRFRAQVHVRGEQVWRDCIQVDVSKLGTDLTTEFARCYADAQGKQAVQISPGRWRLTPDESISEIDELAEPAISEIGGEVSEVEPAISEIGGEISEIKPPHPHIGVPLSVPSAVPSVSQGARDAGEELDPEQQEHLDRLAANGGDVEGWRRSYAAMNREKREAAMAAASVAASEAVKDVELKELYSDDLETAIARMRKRCGFAWTEGDELGPVVRQVFRDQLEMCKPVWRTAAQVEAAWILQRSQPKAALRARFGPLKFIRDGHWLDPNGWHWNV